MKYVLVWETFFLLFFYRVNSCFRGTAVVRVGKCSDTRSGHLFRPEPLVAFGLSQIFPAMKHMVTSTWRLLMWRRYGDIYCVIFMGVKGGEALWHVVSIGLQCLFVDKMHVHGHTVGGNSVEYTNTCTCIAHCFLVILCNIVFWETKSQHSTCFTENYIKITFWWNTSNVPSICQNLTCQLEYTGINWYMHGVIVRKRHGGMCILPIVLGFNVSVHCKHFINTPLFIQNIVK